MSFLPIFFISIIFNFIIALLIGNLNKGNKTFYLVLGIIGNLGVLFFYKYLSFFASSLINPIFKFVQIPQITVPNIIIPLAISFYTFHALSYLLDVYKNVIRPTGKLGKLSLYFLFFPHLIAGPIVRFKEISDQIDQRSITITDFSYGVIRFINGLGKKVLVADILGTVADEIFGIPPAHMTVATAWLGVACFTLQIFFDFSGYTDMAVGLAKMFGFKFPENFDHPYIATSITEFWRRWHMTLSAWIRDYLYYPLAHKWARSSKIKMYIVLLLTFVLVGLWHGANWTFIIFGGIQGMMLVLESLKNRRLINLTPKVLLRMYFLLVITISWVFFRSENVEYAVGFLKRLFFDFTYPAVEYRPIEFFLNNERVIAILIAVILSSSLPQMATKKIQHYLNVNNHSFWIVSKFIYPVLALNYSILVLLISVLFVADQTYTPFLYFKF